ncbi:tyrosine-type recombinase/integrase [Bacillus sp. Marseille-P3800]|uniref:tyrosine-type recombinase/integrase n=1 Tax=Bacillus sp. Marseille-P3800 TaxID=2014782 RepID=UPI000C08A018|nr:site-specific integrase [Bacillus sp. Marseille-P3800]
MGQLVAFNRNFNDKEITNTNKNIDIKAVMERWLLEITNSNRTKINYESDIRDFFKVVKAKGLESLNSEDLRFNLHDFDDFKYALVNERGIKSSTIGRKLVAIKGFLEYVNSRYPEFKIDTSYFNKIKALKSEVDGYATVHVSEVTSIAEEALKSRNKGIIKKYLILFAFDSALRLEEILSIRTSNFIDYDKNHYFYKIIGKKDKRNERLITKEFLGEILQELDIDLKTDQKLFNISPGSIQSFFTNDLQKNAKYSGRKIVFHGIRGAGLTAHYKINGDPVATQEYAKHESFDTTRRYLMLDENTFSGAYSVLNYTDQDALEKLDKEELLKLINSTDPYVKHKLIQTLQK